MKLATFYDHVLAMSEQLLIPISEALEWTYSLGVHYLELSANNILGREETVQAELENCGFKVSSICAYFDFGNNTDIKAEAIPLLETCLKLGAKYMLVIPGFFEQGDTPEVQRKKTANMVLALNSLQVEAKKRDITLIMEDYDSELAPFSTVGGLLHFYQNVPELKCCFDTGNFLFSGEDAKDAYDKVKEFIEHVHLKDRRMEAQVGEDPKLGISGLNLYPSPVGAGCIEVNEILKRLKQDQYTGIYTIEHYDSKDQKSYLEQSVSWVKSQI